MMVFALLLLAASPAGDAPVGAIGQARRATTAMGALSSDGLSDALHARALRLARLPRSAPAPTGTARAARAYAMPVRTPPQDGSGPDLAFATMPDMAVLAPAAGRIAFAGRYRGYGTVMVVDHGAGWKSLLTGMGEAIVAAGDSVTQRQMLGRAAAEPATLVLELRHFGRPIDIRSRIGITSRAR